MTERVPVAIYHSSVLIGVVREQLRFASASTNWQPGLASFPPATPREPNRDAVAAARLSIADAVGARVLPVHIVIAKRSLRVAVRQVAELVGRSTSSARAQAVADGLAMTIVTQLGPCIVDDLTDAGRSSEHEEIEAQTKVRPQPVIVVSTTDLRVSSAVTITPHQWRRQVLMLIR